MIQKTPKEEFRTEQWGMKSQKTKVSSFGGGKLSELLPTIKAFVMEGLEKGDTVLVDWRFPGKTKIQQEANSRSEN